MRWKGILAVVLALLGLAAAWVFLFAKKSPSTLSTVRLPDRTYAQIEGVTFGTNHTFTKGNRIVGKIHRLLPTPFNKLFTPPFLTSFTTTEEMLVLWYNRYDPNTRTYPRANFDSFKVIDEHGCMSHVNQYGGGVTTPGFSVHSAYLGVFPRRQKNFRVRAEVFATTNIEWIVENPFVTNPPTWKPEPLPATRRHENIEFTLEKIAGSGNWYDATFKILHDGVERTRVQTCDHVRRRYRQSAS